MFEQVCLSCGKHLAFDDRPYCSDRCQSGDLVSPTLSSTASSAYSSPYLAHKDGSVDIPPLALNAALQSNGELYASSASSTCWSATDDEDCESSVGYASDCRYAEETSGEPHSKPISLMMPLPARSSLMSYARRPSGLNNPMKARGAVERSISSSSSTGIRGEPRSAPIQSHFHPQSEDELFADADASEEESHPSRGNKKAARRSKNNRASLPAYFSILALKTGSPSKSLNSTSNSSSNTLSRQSPPTPKVDFSVAHAVTASAPAPRGRRKVVDRSDRPDSVSSSANRSATNVPAHRQVAPPTSHPTRRLPSHNSVEQIFDWTNTVAQHAVSPPNIRRNTSPPRNKTRELNHVFARDAVQSALKADGERERRGRYRLEELQGFQSEHAPGLGYGRSGLVGRRGSAVPC